MLVLQTYRLHVVKIQVMEMSINISKKILGTKELCDYTTAPEWGEWGVIHKAMRVKLNYNRNPRSRDVKNVEYLLGCEQGQFQRVAV
jgi:hypothetical protein